MHVHVCVSCACACHGCSPSRHKAITQNHVKLLAEAARWQFAVDDAESDVEDAGPVPPPYTVVLALLQTNPSKPDKKRKQLEPDLEHRCLAMWLS